MTAKILIVDDEDLARERLSTYLAENHPTFVLDEARDGFEAITKIKDFQPAIVFLDIDMPEMNGFEALQNIEERNFQIIFQTAYDRFALRAFDENACDYILKPFSDDRLAQALIKALKNVSQTAALAGLEDELLTEKAYLGQIVVTAGSRKKLIAVDDIHCFVSEHHNTRLFVEGIEYDCDLSLTHLETRLDPERFLRLHRNNVVNLSWVDSVEKSQNVMVRLKDGRTLPVSRSRKKELFDRLGI